MSVVLNQLLPSDSYDIAIIPALIGAVGAIDTSLPANSDYWKRDNLFSLRYCNWNKDLFMGILPNSQFGDIAVVDVSGHTGYSDVRIGTSGLTVQSFQDVKTNSSFLVKPSSTPSSPILLVLTWLLVMLRYLLHSIFLLFVKQKTAYEISRSDWSSDVCSSDLGADSAPLTSEPEESTLMLSFSAICLRASDFISSARSLIESTQADRKSVV